MLNINKLNNKYHYLLNIKEETLKIGNLINVSTNKGRARRVFLGILLKYRKNRRIITITLRNSYKRYSFEKSIILNNTIINEIRFLSNIKYNKVKRNNLYFLRKLKRTHSSF